MSLFKALYTLTLYKDNELLLPIHFRHAFHEQINDWHVSTLDNFMDWIDRTIDAIGVTIPTRDEFWIKQALIVLRRHYAKGDKVFVSRGI